MLSHADALLIARDRAIPGLPTLLDDDAFTAALQALLPAGQVTSATATYTRYKPGENCLVGYTLTTAQGSLAVYARAFAGNREHKLAHARAYHDQAGPLGAGGAILDDLGIAIYVWPNDHGLRQLRHFVEPDRRSQMMHSFRPAQPELGDSTLHDLRYKPARRYVGRLADANGNRALLKLYSERDYTQACLAAGAFRAHGPLRLAEQIGHIDGQRALLFKWLPGLPLPGLLEDPSQPLAPVKMVGAALAELHRQRPARLAQGSGEIAALQAAVHAIGSLCPALIPRIVQLRDILIPELHTKTEHYVSIHGDFYADQVLLGEQHAALLDLDNAAYGDPCSDLGTFAAHLQRGIRHQRWTRERAEQAIEALVEGYHAYHRTETLMNIRLYTAVGLLRLAPEPFRYREPDWPDRVEALVADAEAIMASDYVTF